MLSISEYLAMSTSNGDVRHRTANGKTPETKGGVNGHVVAGKNDVRIPNGTTANDSNSAATSFNLLICVGGIYASLSVLDQINTS